MPNTARIRLITKVMPKADTRIITKTIPSDLNPCAAAMKFVRSQMNRTSPTMPITSATGGITRDGPAHGFIAFRGEVRQVVEPAMNVGIFLGIGAGDRVDHHLRLLRRSAIVQIHQRFAVHLAGEDRKVAADGLHVKH